MKKKIWKINKSLPYKEADRLLTNIHFILRLKDRRIRWMGYMNNLIDTLKISEIITESNIGRKRKKNH